MANAPLSATSSATLPGSALVGLLTELALSDRPAAPPSLVEGLGRWMGWRDAIAVSAALQASPERADRAGGPIASPRSAPAADAAAERLQAEVKRVRDVLERRIDEALHEALHEAPVDALDFLPHRRRYFSVQQAMVQQLAALREQARALLARCSPALAQLAALDAALAGALAPREQALLAQLPVLLEKHHARWRATASAPEAPASAAGLTPFRHDMHRMLLAELELRLQPVLGLLDALRGPAPTSS